MRACTHIYYTFRLQQARNVNDMLPKYVCMCIPIRTVCTPGAYRKMPGFVSGKVTRSQISALPAQIAAAGARAMRMEAILIPVRTPILPSTLTGPNEIAQAMQISGLLVGSVTEVTVKMLNYMIGSYRIHAEIY